MKITGIHGLKQTLKLIADIRRKQKNGIYTTTNKFFMKVLHDGFPSYEIHSCGYVGKFHIGTMTDFFYEDEKREKLKSVKVHLSEEFIKLFCD